MDVYYGGMHLVGDVCLDGKYVWKICCSITNIKETFKCLSCADAGVDADPGFLLIYATAASQQIPIAEFLQLNIKILKWCYYEFKYKG